MVSVKFDTKKALNFNKRELEDRLTLIGEALVTEAKRRTPVDKGRARDSITWATNSKRSKVGAKASDDDAVEAPTKDLAVNVGSAVEYFVHLEFGTKYMRRYAMLRTALIAVKNNYKFLLE